MATWQLGGLPSMAPQNDNAPRSSVPQPVQYQQQPNVGLMALQGLRGVAEINQQARQQQRKAEFQKAYAGAFESGDRNKMLSIQKNLKAFRKGWALLMTTREILLVILRLVLKSHLRSELGHLENS
ncbi:hypothetical protein G849_00483 [Escherichia coli HVH 197 (4-4466217)]|nr:hypothetical protein G849_00483 [Escherichia coli HVH 197 (4-4466217)]